MAYQRRRRFRVRAAFFAAAERERAERCLAARFARRDSAFLDADLDGSRFSAPFVARERAREVFLRPPARANERHVRLREYVPFPHARIRRPEWKEICLRVRLRAPVPLLLLLAYQECFAANYVFGRNEKFPRLSYYSRMLS